VRRHTLSFRLRAPAGERLAFAGIRVDGRRVRKIIGNDLDRPVRLTGLPSGSFVVELRVLTRGGQRFRASRTYRACRD
jgi:hypothetical protein